MRDQINLLYPPRKVNDNSTSLPEEVLDVTPYNLFQFFVRASGLDGTCVVYFQTSMDRYAADAEWYTLATQVFGSSDTAALVVPNGSGETSAVLQYLRWKCQLSGATSVTLQIMGMADHT